MVGAEDSNLAGNEEGNALKKLDASFINGMNKVLQNSQHSDVQWLYVQYGDKLSVADTSHLGGAFYRYGEGVYMNSVQVASGDMIHEPYQTAFHEFGHNIDYIMGRGKPISEIWGNNALYNAIQHDFSNLKGEQSTKQLIESLKKQAKENGWSIKDTASVSDIIESMTGVSYPLGAGHGSAYWENRLPNKEFFAETLDGAAANERSYVLLKTMFPCAVSVVHSIIGGKRV